MESTGDVTLWINGNNERHNIIIYIMVRTGLIDWNQQERNGAVQHKYQQKYMNARSMVH